MDGVPPKNLDRNSARNAVLLVLVALAVAAALFGGRILWRSSGYADWGSPNGLHGRLTVTMTAAGLVAPYVFDFDKGKLTHQSKTSGLFLLQATMASSTGDVAYRCTSAAGVPQVCIYRSKTGSHEVVSRNEFPLKRYLAWSPDEKSILYVASLASTTPPTSPDPNEWGVFLAHADGSAERQVATGSIAFFSPDGSFVYALEKDGLHEHGLASSTDRVAWPVTGGSANRFMTLAVSPDGTKLAWSNPYGGPGRQGNLALFTVVSWRPFTLRYDAAVPLRIWQMQFSPDSGALALSADSSDGQPGLYVYALGSEPKKVLDLQAYEKKTFISEWR